VSNQPEKPYDPVLTLLSRSVLSHDLDLLENLTCPQLYRTLIPPLMELPMSYLGFGI